MPTYVDTVTSAWSIETSSHVMCDLYHAQDSAHTGRECKSMCGWLSYFQSSKELQVCLKSQTSHFLKNLYSLK